MQFVFLTYLEAKGMPIRWDKSTTKSEELVSAALAAGFSDWEIRESPLGALEEEANLGPGCVFKRGARALIGINGCTLLEVTDL